MSRWLSYTKVSKIQVSDPITLAYRRLVMEGILLCAVIDWWKVGCPNRELAYERLKSRSKAWQGGTKDIVKFAEDCLILNGQIVHRDYLRDSGKSEEGCKPAFPNGPAQELREFYASEWCIELYELFTNTDYRQAMKAIKFMENENE